MDRDYHSQEFNKHIISRIARSRLTRYERASIPCLITLYSPQMKIVLARDFESMQGNLYVLMNLARIPDLCSDPSQIEGEIRGMIDKTRADVMTQIAKVTDDINQSRNEPFFGPIMLPLMVEVRMRSALGRKYLALIESADELMRLLEVTGKMKMITSEQLRRKKAVLKREVKHIANYVRGWKLFIQDFLSRLD